MKSLYGFHFLHCILQKLMFPAIDTGHTNFCKICKCSPKSNCISNTSGACLKFIGYGVVNRALEGYIRNHVTTAVIRSCSLKQLLLTINHTDSCRSKYLMSGKDKEIRIQRRNIYRNMCNRLCTVYKDTNTMSVRYSYKLSHRCNCSQNIGNMGYRNKLCLFCKELFVLMKL